MEDISAKGFGVLFCWWGLGAIVRCLVGGQKQYVISDEMIESLDSLPCSCDEGQAVQKTCGGSRSTSLYLGLLSHSVDAAHFRNSSKREAY